jgi:hypothetical protein
MTKISEDMYVAIIEVLQKKIEDSDGKTAIDKYSLFCAARDITGESIRYTDIDKKELHEIILGFCKEYEYECNVDKSGKYIKYEILPIFDCIDLTPDSRNRVYIPKYIAESLGYFANEFCTIHKTENKHGKIKYVITTNKDKLDEYHLTEVDWSDVIVEKDGGIRFTVDEQITNCVVKDNVAFIS